MALGKGFAFSLFGALLGAAVWMMLMRVTGMSLWVLAPIVGGAAGFGMMHATRMRGGIPAGAIAAACALGAIFAARYFTVTGEMNQAAQVSGDDIRETLASEVAAEWEEAGYETYDEDWELLPEVYAEADERWLNMTGDEQQEYASALAEEYNGYAEAMTPFALAFDFGIFGTICAALSVGAAFKTASMTLERALIEKGHAADGETAQALAAQMREEDARRAGVFAPPETVANASTPMIAPLGGPVAAEADAQAAETPPALLRTGVAAQPASRPLQPLQPDPIDPARDAA